MDRNLHSQEWRLQSTVPFCSIPCTKVSHWTFSMILNPEVIEMDVLSWSLQKFKQQKDTSHAWERLSQEAYWPYVQKPLDSLHLWCRQGDLRSICHQGICILLWLPDTVGSYLLLRDITWKNNPRHLCGSPWRAAIVIPDSVWEDVKGAQEPSNLSWHHLPDGSSGDRTCLCLPSRLDELPWS